MVRHAKWISSTAVGLILAWNGLPAQAQRFTFDSEPALSPSTLADETDEQDNDAVVDEEMEVETQTGDSDSDTTDSTDSDSESGYESTRIVH